MMKAPKLKGAAAHLLLLISNGFPAFWQVNSYLGIGLTRASSGKEVLNRTGYEEFENPLGQLHFAVSRVSDKNLLGLSFGVAGGSLKRDKHKTDSNFTDTFDMNGINAIGGRKLFEKDPFNVWGTAEIGFGGFEMGARTSDAEPGIYDSFYLNGTLGLEGAYNKRFTSRGYYVLGAYLKGGVTKTYDNEGIYLPIVMCGLKMGLAFEKI